MIKGIELFRGKTDIVEDISKLFKYHNGIVIVFLNIESYMQAQNHLFVEFVGVKNERIVKGLWSLLYKKDEENLQLSVLYPDSCLLKGVTQIRLSVLCNAGYFYVSSYKFDSFPVQKPGEINRNSTGNYGNTKTLISMSEPQVMYHGNPAYTPDSVKGNSNNYRQKFEAHIELNVGKINQVLQDMFSTVYPIEVYHILPGFLDVHVLVTFGMSRCAMDMTNDRYKPRYCELVMTLPSQWPFPDSHLDYSQHTWPINLLRSLARFPHVNQRCI
ncbi:MAG: suppressor of fused domain protein, partial [Desulfamplus sp.]|nr:suppressor of fused domain protein [Desulfamplus sp.]